MCTTAAIRGGHPGRRSGAAIAWIGAHSPQAKGRVERVWGTLQDRLVSELRRRRAATINEVNEVLAAYLPRHNTRFAVPAAIDEPAWRAWADGLVAASVFAIHYPCKVARDATISWDGVPLALPRRSDGRSWAGRVGAYDQVDMALLDCRLGEGFTGWVAQHGEPILVNDANRDPPGQTIPGTDDVDESMLVVPMRYDDATMGVIALSKLGLDGFGPDDLRLLTILADQAATAVGSARLLQRTQDLADELRRLLDMSSELSGSLDPRQVAELIAGHLVRGMGADECVISYWDRPAGRVDSLGSFPTHRLKEIDPFYDVSGYPATLRVLERQETLIIKAGDPAADPAEVELLVRDGNMVLAMLPLVAKGQSIGLVELVSHEAVTWSDERIDLARTMANEAAMALENARLYEEARNLADRDPLTGFYNHRFLHERLGEEVVRTQRGRRPLSVLMLDLDDFKLVNDTFGHLFGDRVLTWTAELIRSTLRASDIPARYGGDEFAIILPETNQVEARRAAERILEAFRDRAFVGEHHGPVPIGASIGAATFPADGRTGTELIAAADQALYRVKRDGGHDAALAGDGAAA